MSSQVKNLYFFIHPFEVLL